MLNFWVEYFNTNDYYQKMEKKRDCEIFYIDMFIVYTKCVYCQNDFRTEEANTKNQML